MAYDRIFQVHHEAYPPSSSGDRARSRDESRHLLAREFRGVRLPVSISRKREKNVSPVVAR